MTSPFCLPAALSPPLTGREAVADAMYRCAMAFDLNDGALFDSSFMCDGVLEINGRAMTGLAEIHATGLVLIFALDTTHMVTNVRVHMTNGSAPVVGAAEENNEASLTATVLSQHFVAGKGLELGQKDLMAGSFYRGDLVRDTDGLWKFKHLQVKSAWMEGDMSVVGGNFSEME